MTTPNINTILRQNKRPCTRGAPMGAMNIHKSETPLHVQRVNYVDGDYAPDGTYWGGGRDIDPIYCAFNGSDCPDYAPAMGSRIYVRAPNRAKAIELLQEEYGGFLDFKAEG